MDHDTNQKIKEAVREAYGDLARQRSGQAGRSSCCGPQQPSSCCGTAQPSSCCGTAQPSSCCGTAQPSSCCGSAETATVASAATLYAADEIADLPDSVTDISLGCGNPTAIAGLQPGEVVLDLGSGGGIDCFLAAKKVGPQGRVIGLDMTPDMVKLAQRNAKKLGAWNVEFRLGEMEDMPLPDSSVDVIISNCVINLSPDKDAVFAEAYRVLRPGGRMSVSDIVLQGELPPSLHQRLDVWTSCVAGALDEADYLGKMRAAGFEDVEVLSRDYIKVSEFPEWESMRSLVAGSGLDLTQIDHKIASVKVKARRPA
ncbi:MAG: arsenite methyltransferase [Chloroflexi bacterium]|nr:arsenite methyltransferase [Chloroflexota bacterium]